MIIGIGCDTVDHKVTEALDWPSLPKKINRIFTQLELSLLTESNRLKFLSGRFAAKEAALKSIGTGIEDGISLKEIEILRDDFGRPQIKLTGDLKQIADKMKITNWHISISHTESTSMAYVIAEGV